MADTLTHEELRALSLKQLELRIEKISATLSNPIVEPNPQAAPKSDLSAAKSMLAMKKSQVTMLNASAHHREVLSNLFFHMSEEERVDAYDYYADKQKTLFRLYLAVVTGKKPELAADAAEAVVDGVLEKGSEYQYLDRSLVTEGFPTLWQAFESVKRAATVVYENEEGSEREGSNLYHQGSLREAMRDHGHETDEDS